MPPFKLNRQAVKSNRAAKRRYCIVYLFTREGRKYKVNLKKYIPTKIGYRKAMSRYLRKTKHKVKRKPNKYLPGYNKALTVSSNKLRPEFLQWILKRESKRTGKSFVKIKAVWFQKTVGPDGSAKKIKLPEETFTYEL